MMRVLRIERYDYEWVMVIWRRGCQKQELLKGKIKTLVPFGARMQVEVKTVKHFVRIYLRYLQWRQRTAL